jgi:hypothetical protein
LPLIHPRGSFALSISTRDLNNRFLSEMDANDYFVDVVINSYLMTALHAFRSNARKVARLKRKTRQAKLQWMREQNQRRINELYLGVQPFFYEPRRCCEEFYKELKKAWGFTSVKLLLMK